MVGGSDSHIKALEMLNAFGSVGATRFDVTWTNIEVKGQPKKQLFRRGVALDVVTRSMPVLIAQATERQRNLIVRPYAPPCFIQLDDLDAVKLERVQPVAFLTIETSPGNHQAWVAVAGDADEDFARRLRKGIGADPTASGATRLAGSFNFKEKYAPDFPRVEIGHTAPGRIVTAAALTSMGLVAAVEPMRPARAAPAWQSQGRKWPDYQRCLDGAPANQSGSGPDTSRADFTFAMIAADWGFSQEDVAARLMEDSTKAQENGPNYAKLTAAKGAAAARRNKQPASLRGMNC